MFIILCKCRKDILPSMTGHIKMIEREKSKKKVPNKQNINRIIIKKSYLGL